jgi:hypothetical protein
MGLISKKGNKEKEMARDNVKPDKSLEPIVVLMINPKKPISIVVSKWNSSL